MRLDEEITVSLALLAIILAGYLILAATVCHSRWSGSGFAASWGPFKGCTIQTRRGGPWIPEDRYREIAD